MLRGAVLSSQWRGTYGVLFLGVAFAAALLVYHRARREGSHSERLAAALQEALYDLAFDPARAAERLSPLVAGSSPAKATPWLLETLGAAHARQALAAQESSAREALLRRALAVYGEILSRHPDHPAAPLALMATGQIYEDLGSDDLSAATAYARLLARYPGTPPAALVDARFGVAEALARAEERAEKDAPRRTPLDVIRMRLSAARRRYQEMLAEEKKREAAAESGDPAPGEPETADGAPEPPDAAPR